MSRSCRDCGHENPDAAKFCLECGARFASSCSGCGIELPASARFCPECGARVGGRASPPSAAPERSPRDYTPAHLADRILTSRSALEGERKIVTVLFVDVQRSLELAGDLDPEEWHAVLDGFFQILTDGVHRFEGTVNQYTGDGIMALFGAPLAHEDHAQRACYAALALRDALRSWSDGLRIERGIGVSVRMGINSGEVVVGKIGDDLRMDYTAQGQTVGLAQRMEQLAEARTICLSDRTARLLGDWFVLRNLGSPSIKGISGDLRVYELEGVGEARTRLESSRARGFSKFVGRGEEYAALEAALARARSGQGGVIGIVADAGTGKSRLSHEFMERCRAEGVLVRHVYGVAHGKGIPLLPVLDLMRQAFGIGPRDGDAAARQKIAGAVVLLDESLREDLPLLFDFLGVPDPQRPAPAVGAEVRQRRILDLVRRLLMARGRRDAVVMVFEDLHWIDPASEAFVEALAGATEGVRSLLIVNFRPEYHADWMRRSNYQQLALRPLDATAIAEMLEEWVGSDASLRGVPARICERTGGTPFFVEEVVQALIESGTLVGTRGAYRLDQPLEAFEVPATVQALLASRIDRLAEREKRTLQTAAVIGKEFSRSLLARVADLPDRDLDAALYGLIQSEFVYEQALYPEVAYAFKHPLTQEVALGSQLRERRARVHAAVAAALEALHAEQLDEKAALLAHHWTEAGDAVVAARWHLRAARWTGGRETEATVSHMLTARALLDGAPESQESLRLGAEVRAQLLPYTGRSRRVYDLYEEFSREGESLARRLGDELTWARVTLSRVYAAVQHEGGHGYAPALVEATATADRDGDLDLRIALRTTSVASALTSGEHSVTFGIRLADEALALAGDRRTAGFAELGLNAIAMLWSMKGGLLSLAGRSAEAVRSFERGITLTRELDDLLMAPAAYAFSLHPFACDDLIDPETAMRLAERCAEVGERSGTSAGAVLIHWAQGAARARAGDLPEAAESFESMVTLSQENGALTGLRGLGCAELALAVLPLDPDRAREAMDRALVLRPVSWEGPRYDVADARVSLARGEGEAAAAAIARGRALMRAMEAPSWEPEFARLEAQLALLA